MKKLSCVALLALAVIVLPSCGGKDSPSAPSTPAPPPAPTRAVITVSIVPSPIVATATNDATFPLRAGWTTVITETAGLAANVNLVNVTNRDVTTGLEFNTLTYTVADVQRATGGANFIAARGTLNVPLSFVYRGSFGGRQLNSTITVQVIDGLGNQVNASATVPVI